MTKKAFAILISILLFTFVFTFILKQYKPEITIASNLKDFPLLKSGWVGQRDNVASYVIDMLNPEEIFSATFTNTTGVKINLLFVYSVVYFSLQQF